jgi:hypothetical protein
VTDTQPSIWPDPQPDPETEPHEDWATEPPPPDGEDDETD